MNELIKPGQFDPIIDDVCNRVTSPHTKRAYSDALTEFISWIELAGATSFNATLVFAYRQQLIDAGKGNSTINVKLAAIRKLAEVARMAGFIDRMTCDDIRSVKGVPTNKGKLGNWLTKERAQELLDAPDIETLKGLRDRALLALLLGCGLRRQECTRLTVEHIQQREARWVIVDMRGKRDKERSVPMAAWIKAAVDQWTAAAGIRSGVILRPVNRGGKLAGEHISSQTVFDVVVVYAKQIDANVRPHDLRRTFAKLAHKGGAAIEQIQLSLGHDSVKTTELYLGVDQDLHDAPSDKVGLKI